MNNPSDTDDQGLLDDLESEYIAMAEAGEGAAISFAIAESEEVIISIEAAIMGLMRNAKDDSNDLYLAIWARVARRSILARLSEHAAPKWAAQELPKRTAEMREMRDEWEETEVA